MLHLKEKHFILSGLFIVSVVVIAVLFTDRIQLKNSQQKIIHQLKDSLFFYQQIEAANTFLLQKDFSNAIRKYRCADSLSQQLKYTKPSHDFVQFILDMQDSLIAYKQLKNEKTTELLQAKANINQYQEKLTVKEKLLDTIQIAQSNIIKILGKQLEENQKLQEAYKTITDSLHTVKNLVKEMKIINKNGIKINYYGNTKSDKAFGFGIGLYETGSVYKGNWKDNNRDGFGMYKWSNGDIYEGYFENDKRSGIGTYYFKSGEKYVGGWKNDMRNGEGEYYDEQGKLILKGTWIDDKIQKH